MQMNEVRLPAKLFSVSLLYNILLCEGIFKQFVEPDVGTIFTQKYARIRDGMQRMKSKAKTKTNSYMPLPNYQDQHTRLKIYQNYALKLSTEHKILPWS